MEGAPDSFFPFLMVPCSRVPLISPLILIVLVTLPFCPDCFQVFPPIVIESRAFPYEVGLSSHSKVKVISPSCCAGAKSFLPSSENLALNPGDDELIINVAFVSSPSPSLNFNLLPLWTTYFGIIHQ